MGTVKRPAPTEAQVIRYACYVAFFTCAIGLVTSLALRADAWPGFMTGTALFGLAAGWMFNHEVNRRENEAARAGSQGGGRYVVMDADDPDGA